MTNITLHNPATVTYLRKATPGKDGYAGVLYLHHFVTGAQELVFRTRADAQDFAERETLAGRPTKHEG